MRERMIAIEQAAKEISRETAYSPDEIVWFLRSAFRQLSPIVKECTHVSRDEIDLAKAICTRASACNISPSRLIPPGDYGEKAR